MEGEDYQPVNEILTFEPHEREKEVRERERADDSRSSANRSGSVANP